MSDHTETLQRNLRVAVFREKEASVLVERLQKELVNAEKQLADAAAERQQLEQELSAEMALDAVQAELQKKAHPGGNGIHIDNSDDDDDDDDDDAHLGDDDGEGSGDFDETGIVLMACHGEKTHVEKIAPGTAVKVVTNRSFVVFAESTEAKSGTWKSVLTNTSEHGRELQAPRGEAEGTLAGEWKMSEECDGVLCVNVVFSLCRSKDAVAYGQTRFEIPLLGVERSEGIDVTAISRVVCRLQINVCLPSLQKFLED